MSDVIAVCNSGHPSVWKDFEQDEDVIAAFNVCHEMVAKPEFGGLVLECGDKVIWLKNLEMVDNKPKKRRFRSKQLDLFYDAPKELDDRSNPAPSDS